MAPRATAAEVLKLLGGSYPGGFNATNVGNLLQEADYVIDDYARSHYNTTLSTTDAEVIAIANNAVVDLIEDAQWLHASPNTRGPRPDVPSKKVMARIDAHLGNTTYDGSYTGDMVSDT